MKERLEGPGIVQVARARLPFNPAAGPCATLMQRAAVKWQ